MSLQEAEDTIYQALADTLAFGPDTLTKGEEDQELRYMAQHVLECLSAKFVITDRWEDEDGPAENR
jgi:hypothetical protein